MKKKICLYITTLLFLSTACSDSFLDLAPESQMTESTFFQTEDHFNQAVTGIYEGLRAIKGKAGYLMTEQRSDNAHYVRNEVDRGQRTSEDIADFTDDAINGYTAQIYRDCYSAIARANTVIDRIQTKNFSAAFTNRIIGEAKVLRAYYYFELVRYFGGVSLHLEEVNNPDKAFLPRASVDQVYEAIIADLKDGIEKLENPTFPQVGRVSKGTAKMIYADVLMTKPQRDYATAEQQLKDIMKMGYGLIEYSELFDNKHKNSIESIFEVQYKAGDTGQQSDYIYRMMPLTNDGVAITGVAGSNNTSNGGNVIPNQELVDMYEPGDKRLNVSIAVAVGVKDNQTGIMEIDDVLEVGDPQIATYTSFCYFVNKYRNPHEKINNTDDNFPIYRYSEVLLSLAECLVAQNRADEAVEHVNAVRNRAGLPSLTVVTADDIEKERRVELAFENKRWHDLIRTGKAVSVMNAYGNRMKVLYPYIEARAYNVTEDRLIYPLPYRELQINTQLKQNPGY